jgi:hypothetical protein
MTTRIGPNPDGSIGAFIDSLAAVYGSVGAPPAPWYSQVSAPQWSPFQQAAPMALPPFAGQPYGGIPMPRIMPSIPGAPAIGVKLQPLGFSTVTFTATSGTALAATTRPQKPFKGRRLVCDVARTGATSTGLVTVTSVTIGVNNQFVSTGPVGVGAFAATAFDCNVELSACSSALDINVNYAIAAAPTMTDTVAIATTLFGETVGS